MSDTLSHLDQQRLTLLDDLAKFMDFRLGGREQMKLLAGLEVTTKAVEGTATRVAHSSGPIDSRTVRADGWNRRADRAQRNGGTQGQGEGWTAFASSLTSCLKNQQRGENSVP
jgi:hypothetical protein